MKTLSKLFRALGKVIRNPYLLNAVLDQEEEHQRQMLAEGTDSSGLPEIAFNQFLPASGVTVSPFAFLDGGSLPTDLALIRLLAPLTQAETYFEIGTWRGESVMQAAQVFKQAYTLNLPDEEMRRRGWEEAYINLHRYFSARQANVIHLQGDSRKFNTEALEGNCDFVFVDGDHHYDSVVNDTQLAFRLIRKGGIIVWHDYAHSPEQVRWNVFHGIMKGAPESAKPHLYSVSNTLCAAYLPNYTGETSRRQYPSKPNPGFSLTIQPYQS